MPIGFSFNQAPDARRKLGGDRPFDRSSPCPIIPPKSNPSCSFFSRFPSPPLISTIPSSHRPVSSTHHRTVHQATSPHTTTHNLNSTSSTSLQLHVSHSSISPVSTSHTTHNLNSTSSHVVSYGSISPVSISDSLPSSHARFISSFSNPSFSHIPSSNPPLSA
jgi:hypothetical protein